MTEKPKHNFEFDPDTGERLVAKEMEQTSKLVCCSDCGKEVSRRANSCPNCGAPISASINTITHNSEKDVQTIQATGRDLKVHILISLGIFFVGLFMLISGETGGFWLMVLAAIYYLVVKFRIWWCHK